MWVPAIQGVIDRRILVNYRVSPDALAQVLPAPFRPKLVNGWGIAGICLIRLRGVRPRFVPAQLGLRSENAAHRIAVTWQQRGQTHEGVYIPRRDTNSCLNVVAGGTVFPGIHHDAHFEVNESADRFEVHMRSRDGEAWLDVIAHVAEALPTASVFDSVQSASSFFEAGSLGYSATRESTTFHGIELNCHNWHVEPMSVERIASSFFDDASQFASGEAVFDHALLMRGIEHEWQARAPLYCNEPAMVSDHI